MSKLRETKGLTILTSHFKFLLVEGRDEGVTRIGFFEYPFQLKIRVSENLGGDNLVLFKARDDVGRKDWSELDNSTGAAATYNISVKASK